MRSDVTEAHLFQRRFNFRNGTRKWNLLLRLSPSVTPSSTLQESRWRSGGMTK